MSYIANANRVTVCDANSDIELSDQVSDVIIDCDTTYSPAEAVVNRSKLNLKVLLICKNETLQKEALYLLQKLYQKQRFPQ